MAQASAKKLEQTVPTESVKVALASQSEQLARTLDPFMPKGKGAERSISNRKIMR